MWLQDGRFTIPVGGTCQVNIITLATVNVRLQDFYEFIGLATGRATFMLCF
jgi:hypothetical protein